MTNTRPDNIVTVENLWVSYGSFQAVRGISFNIPRGEVFGFIGPNGAGKSSAMKVLATLLGPTYGTVMIDGVSVLSKPEIVRSRIGYMPDFFGVYDDLSVTDYLQFFAAAYQLPPDERVRTIGDVLELTDLTRKRLEPVESLSRGMKQRLALARVLLHDPKLLLLDEPASGLDPRARIEMRELLKALRDMGKTILISSHILHELAHLCTRIGVIEAGRLVAEGSLDDIRRRLGLEQLVHIEIENLNEGMVGAIKSIHGVVDVAAEGRIVEVQILTKALQPADLLNEIHKCGARICLFEPQPMDMETVFMKLTAGITA